MILPASGKTQLKQVLKQWYCNPWSFICTKWLIEMLCVCYFLMLYDSQTDREAEVLNSSFVSPPNESYSVFKSSVATLRSYSSCGTSSWWVYFPTFPINTACLMAITGIACLTNPQNLDAHFSASSLSVLQLHLMAEYSFIHSNFWTMKSVFTDSISSSMST